MRVLFLGEPDNPLALWLEDQGETVLVKNEKLNAVEVSAFHPDFLISYNYRFILPAEILQIPSHIAVNLHISYLPWNRGADPNVWSHLENTPKGVTIHILNEGLDTGPVLFQKEIGFHPEATLSSSYDSLQYEIQKLFRNQWKNLKSGNYQAVPQTGNGSYHRLSDRDKFLSCLGDEGWDVSIEEFKKRFALLGSK